MTDVDTCESMMKILLLRTNRGGLEGPTATISMNENNSQRVISVVVYLFSLKIMSYLFSTLEHVRIISQYYQHFCILPLHTHFYLCFEASASCDSNHWVFEKLFLNLQTINAWTLADCLCVLVIFISYHKRLVFAKYSEVFIYWMNLNIRCWLVTAELFSL